MSRDTATVDFETEVIENRPVYPPVPGAVSIKINGKRPRYYAWKHDKGNNCTKTEARAALKAVWDQDVVFHNAGFDIEVARKHLRLPRPKRFHDTLFLTFLYDPFAQDLGLKVQAHELLNMPPDEKDSVGDWLESRGYQPFDLLRAPVKLASLYGNGDTERTYELYTNLLPAVESMGMRDAYNAERNVMYTVLDMEERGVHIDYYPLERDTCKWEKDRDECTKIVFKHLGELNLNSGKQLSTALLERGYAKEDGWPRTEPSKNFPNGQLQTTAHALQKVVTHKKLLAALLRRSKLEHMMNNFAYPWLDRMEGYGRARLWPEFNQVRGRDERDRGTRSGRFSSANPNFQQLNREPDDLTLPFMRRYLLPEPGHLLLGRDFNQQELRILAHFEGNLLKDLYLEDPKLDIHDLIKGFMVASTGEDIDRAHIKRLNFGTIYGMGADKFAWMEGIEDLSYARYLHRLHKNKFPGLRDINKSLRELSDNGDPIATRMGRLYFPTPGKEYVQLNRLIQGSAADHMKFVLPLVADAVAPYGAYILLTVHDEILVSCPKEHVKPCMRDFRISMETPFFDIPIPTDGKIGRNWGAMRKCLH